MPRLVSFFQEPGAPLIATYDDGVAYSAVFNEARTTVSLTNTDTGQPHDDNDMESQLLEATS